MFPQKPHPYNGRNQNQSQISSTPPSVISSSSIRYATPASLPPAFGVEPLHMWQSSVNTSTPSHVGTLSSYAYSESGIRPVPNSRIFSPQTPVSTADWVKQTSNAATPASVRTGAESHVSHSYASTPIQAPNFNTYSQESRSNAIAQHKSKPIPDDSALNDGDFDVDGSVPDSDDEDEEVSRRPFSKYIDDSAQETGGKRKRKIPDIQNPRRKAVENAGYTSSEEEPKARKRRKGNTKDNANVSSSPKKKPSTKATANKSRAPNKPKKKLFQPESEVEDEASSNEGSSRPPASSNARSSRISKSANPLSKWSGLSQGVLDFFPKLQNHKSDPTPIWTYSSDGITRQSPSHRALGCIHFSPSLAPGEEFHYWVQLPPPDHLPSGNMPKSVLSLLARPPKNLSFVESWEISNQQSPHLTCVEASALGQWVMSASEDGTMLFVSVDSGSPVGIIDFGDHMFVLCATWRAGSKLLIGCTNGVLYELLINPKNALHPASMYPLLGPLPQQIISLAIDSSGLHTLLAVGYGSRTAVYAHTPPGYEWNKVEEIEGPSEDRSSLVNSLFFFGETQRKLFIGYAEEGWSIWKYDNSTDIQHFSPLHYPAICRIGQARLSPDQQSVSISTLDQSIATYKMSDRGPIPETIKAFPLQVPVSASPILPVAHTSTDLILGGTAAGDVPIVRSRHAAVPRLHQGDGHLIRTITPYGSSIIVGSTGPKNEVILKCFSQNSWAGQGLWSRRQATATPFRVTLSDVLVSANEANKRTVPEVESKGSFTKFLQSNVVKVAIVFISIFTVLALSSTPPGGKPYVAHPLESTQTGVAKAESRRHYLWIHFGLKQLYQYFLHQWGEWGYWVWSTISKFVTTVVCIPYYIVDALLMKLAEWICKHFDIYRSLGICPELTY
ncbi:hypothetical protein FRC09_016365 [Ceratobasidium sp. 395]|nr:hypothetical protein FRC09_016365 [Ceratobasidium sp. 395]